MYGISPFSTRSTINDGNGNRIIKEFENFFWRGNVGQHLLFIICHKFLIFNIRYSWS